MTTLVMPLAVSHRPALGLGSLEACIAHPAPTPISPAMPQRPTEGSSRLKGHAHRASHRIWRAGV